MEIEFNVFGKKMVVQRNSEEWRLFLDSGTGVRTRVTDIVIPSDLSEDELVTFLDDMYHEHASEKYPEVVKVKEE